MRAPLSSASELLTADALSIYRAAVAASHAGRLVERALCWQGDGLTIGNDSLRPERFGSILVVGAGKSAEPMARALMAALAERGLARRCRGMVAVAHTPSSDVGAVRLVQTRHSHENLPTQDGVQFATSLAQLLRQASEDTLVFFLLAGGASALLPLPADGVSVTEKARATRMLAAAGATITELNTVRRHLSQLKGGQLAALATPATVVSLIVSDVVGDDLSVVGSGPTFPDATSYGDAVEVLERYRVYEDVPNAVKEHLKQGVAGLRPDTPAVLPSTVTNHVVGGPVRFLEDAQRIAAERGFRVVDLGAGLVGPANDLGVRLAELVLSNRSPDSPLCFLGVGETTVCLGENPGLGGRNQELVLAALERLTAAEDVSGDFVVLSAGSDGEDGPTDAAGAYINPRTLGDAMGEGDGLRTALLQHDAYPYLEKKGALIKTGWTETNVLDLQAVLLRPRAKT